jgi:hypothetical protein
LELLGREIEYRQIFGKKWQIFGKIFGKKWQIFGKNFGQKLANF